MDTTEPLLLIVDDSRVSRIMLRGLIDWFRPTWRILESANGDDAITAVAEHRPSYISMDMNMPGTNGLEAARQIRQQNPEIRIALCTSNIQESTQKAAEAAGIRFVGKPITEKSVQEMIAYFELAP